MALERSTLEYGKYSDQGQKLQYEVNLTELEQDLKTLNSAKENL